MDEFIETMNSTLKTLLAQMKMQGDPSNQSLKDKGMIAWVQRFDERSGTLHLGLALGTASGCSPFCGCAAREIAEVIGDELQRLYPQVRRTIGLAELPPTSIVALWNEGTSA